MKTNDFAASGKPEKWKTANTTLTNGLLILTNGW